MKMIFRKIVNWLNISAHFLFWINFVLFIFLVPWTLLLAIPGSPLVALGKQVWYVTFISHIALILGALSTLQAARVEIRQEAIETEKLKTEKKVEHKLEIIKDRQA